MHGNALALFTTKQKKTVSPAIRFEPQFEDTLSLFAPKHVATTPRSYRQFQCLSKHFLLRSLCSIDDHVISNRVIDL